MVRIEDKPTCTVEQARGILTAHTLTRGVCIDLDRCLDYVSYYTEKYKPTLKAWRTLAGDATLQPTKRKDIANNLITRFGLSPERFAAPKGGLTVNDDIVKGLLNKPDIDEDLKEYLTLYSNLSTYSYRISYLDQYRFNPLLSVESFEGHRMVLARPEWNILATSRISATGPSLQNITYDFADIVTCPKGYQLVRADSGQIEPRITYSYFIPDELLKALIVLYNDAYLGMLHFCKMTSDEENRARRNLTTLEKKEWDISLRKMLKVLGLAGNYGGGLASSDLDQELASVYRARIVNHPLRKKFEKEVEEAVDRGADTFYSAFGTPITPEETTKYKKNEPGWRGHLIRCGINNPIQTTASDLMCQSVYESDKIIREEGRGASSIVYYKHDEGCFMVHEKDVDLIPKLSECTAYQVRDWIPIYSDVDIGKKGGMPDVV